MWGHVVVKVVGQVLFWSFYIFWLVALTLLSPLSLFIKPSVTKLEQDLVFQSETICKLLYDRSLLSEEEYMFEHTLVVDSYHLEVFKGYQVIVFPVVWALKKSRILDRHVLYFVRSWMRVQKERLLGKGQAPKFHKLFTRYAIFMAGGVGRLVRVAGSVYLTRSS